MRRLMVLAAVVLLASTTWAEVWVTVYRCDATTPLPALDPNHPTVYRDIMVGTRLVLVVNSDTGELWQGALLLSQDYAKYSTLSGRGYTAGRPGTGIRTPNYVGSCLEAAGTAALAWDFDDSRGVGFEFRTDGTPYITGGHPATPGDWFVFDYRAEKAGTVSIGLYNSLVTYDVPIETFFFAHVPSRDFNVDAVVNFQDLALLASHWGASDKSDPNDPNSMFDLNGDTMVDLADLSLFSEYWLAQTDCPKLAVDPGNPCAGNP